MIKLENTEVHGMKAAIRGMRNPMNSWKKSDSLFCKNYITHENNCGACCCVDGIFLGRNDLDLAKRLAHGGPVHGKYLRYIVVSVDITAPLYWWKEFDTYRVGVAPNPTDIEYNSCSTMHKIHVKEFTMDDFSHEHLIDVLNEEYLEKYCDENGQILIGDNPIIMSGCDSYWDPDGILMFLIRMLNRCRELYLETKDKRFWWQMIQLLPSSYNQRRTVQLNYEVLRGQYKYRKDHKLDEWHQYCIWSLTLPYFKELCVDKE